MPVNVYGGSYLFRCDRCLCRYCVNAACPAGNRGGGFDYDFCVESSERGACPRLDCDFFIHRRLQAPRYRMVKRGPRPTLRSIERRLRRLENILTNNQTK